MRHQTNKYKATIKKIIIFQYIRVGGFGKYAMALRVSHRNSPTRFFLLKIKLMLPINNLHFSDLIKLDLLRLESFDVFDVDFAQCNRHYQKKSTLGKDYSFIYVLFYDSQIVYIGRTKNFPKQRVDEHCLSKIFNRMAIVLSSDCSYFFERKLIKLHNPLYNQEEKTITGLSHKEIKLKQYSKWLNGDNVFAIKCFSIRNAWLRVIAEEAKKLDAIIAEEVKKEDAIVRSREYEKIANFGNLRTKERTLSEMAAKSSNELRSIRHKATIVANKIKATGCNTTKALLEKELKSARRKEAKGLKELNNIRHKESEVLKKLKPIEKKIEEVVAMARVARLEGANILNKSLINKKSR